LRKSGGYLEEVEGYWRPDGYQHGVSVDAGRRLIG